MRKRPHASRRGSAITLAIIVSIVITALVCTLSWVVGEQSQRVASLSKMDQAFYAAEAGAQRVQWYCKKGRMSSLTAPRTGSINGYNYSVSWSTVSGSTIKITSVGSLGNVSYALSQQVTPPVTQQPALAAADDFNNKNIDIIGDVIVGGSYTNGGSGSITGDLTYYGSASNTGSVSGTITHAGGSFTPIDINALGTTLIAAAGRTYNGLQVNRTFDFTTIPGDHKVIYVNGSVINPSFIGSGTLYVSDVADIDDFGTAANPVHIVVRGPVVTNNNITVYGSLYTGSVWGRGKMDWTGIIYVADVIIPYNNGHSSVTQTDPPWFDPRGGGGGSSANTTVTNFAGPMP